MRELQDIRSLLDELEHRSVDTLEGQDLNFKQWDSRSTDKAVKSVVAMAICMANGGGGVVVFGVDDKAIGRKKAILGVPPEVDINRLKKAVYDSTDPKLTPVFRELSVPEGTGRLIIMQIYPGLPPYTDTTGRGTIRVGKDCQPLTGTLRRKIMIETGETDFTAGHVPGSIESLISASAMEHLREVILNALIHADYRIHGPILVKQFRDRLEISNPGGLAGGITPENILQHEPIARNPLLVDALTRLRLVNRSNLGVRRMYQALLIEGKEPPRILDEGEAVRVIIRASDVSIPFRMFVAEEADRGRYLSVEQLLVVQHLLRHPEIDTETTAKITQQTEVDARETMNQTETAFGYLERGGTGRGTYWTLRHDLHGRLSALGHPERDRRIDWEAAKTRVLSILRQRAGKREPGLTNAEIRKITHFDRSQVKRLMAELAREGAALREGRGRGANWLFKR